MVVLADIQQDLQRALAAIGAWGARWRFSFGIGPDKTAVLVVGSRSSDFRVTFQGLDVPVVTEYCCLGVGFQASRKWRKRSDRLAAKSTRKFHQPRLKNRGLHTGFRRSLFHAYVFASMLHGAALMDDTPIRRLNRLMRHWGVVCFPGQLEPLVPRCWANLAGSLLHRRATVAGKLVRAAFFHQSCRCPSRPRSPRVPLCLACAKFVGACNCQLLKLCWDRLLSVWSLVVLLALSNAGRNAAFAQPYGDHKLSHASGRTWPNQVSCRDWPLSSCAILASISVQAFIAPGCLHPWSANGHWQALRGCPMFSSLRST